MSQIEEIKQRIDIVEIVEGYLKLARAGTNYKGVCPFHQEKTPSFMVSSDKQIFHCFGCGAGGDAIEFIQKIEGIEFPEALRILAQKAGVELERHNPEVHNKRTKLLDILDQSTKFYREVLLRSHQAGIARDYIKNREIDDITSETFRIGYAPSEWDSLYKFLKKREFSDQDIEKAGMILKRKQGIGYYDRFRERIMFPLLDVHGNVIGFTGRLLDESKSDMGKYVNTPQTEVFDKSRVLYGIDKAKTEIRKAGFALLVEGQMDVISCYRAGIMNVVASSGTALTEMQIVLLRRYTSEFRFAFDMDEAGIEAAKRGAQLASAQGVDVKVVVTPSGKDPDEAIKMDENRFKKAIQDAVPFMDFYFNHVLHDVDFQSVNEKKRVSKLLLEQIQYIKDGVEKTHYIQKLAGVLRVPENVLYDAIPRASQRFRVNTVDSASDKMIIQNKEELSYSERIIALILKAPHTFTIFDSAQIESVLSEDFRALYKKLKSYYNDSSSDQFGSEVLEAIKSDSLKKIFLAGDYLFESFEYSDFEKEASILSQTFKKRSITDRLQVLEQEIQYLEQQKPHDTQRLQSLVEEVSKLTSRLQEAVN